MSRKLMFGFALLIVTALTGTNTAYADDIKEKQDPTQSATDNEKKPDETQPIKELPLYPKEHAITIAVRQRGWSHEAVLIDVVLDDGEHRMHVWGERAEEILSFRLRTDGLPHASAQFFGKPYEHPDIFTSAVVLVPDEESLQLWQEWMTRELKKERGGRAYPARVLPPK